MTVRNLWSAFDNWNNETTVLIHHEGNELPETYNGIKEVLDKYGSERVYLFWYFDNNRIAILLK